VKDTDKQTLGKMIDNHIRSSGAWSSLRGGLQVIAKMPDIRSTPTYEGFGIKTSFAHYNYRRF